MNKEGEKSQKKILRIVNENKNDKTKRNKNDEIRTK